MNDQLFAEMAQVQDGHWWYQGRRAVVGAVLRRLLAPDATRRVLDIGSGTGGMLPVLLEFGSVDAMEASPRALQLCRQRFGAQVRLHQGLLPEGVPGREAFALVTAFDVLEHIPDAQLEAALAAIHGALVPGGHFLCTVPAYRFLWSEHDEVHGHQRRYTRRMLRSQLEGAGLEVSYVSYFNTLLFPPIAAARLAGRLRPPHAQQSDLRAPAPWVNAVLGGLFGLERHVVPRVPLPFGVSLLAVCRRPEAQAPRAPLPRGEVEADQAPHPVPTAGQARARR